MLQASGSDPAPGFCLCSASATTILDTGSDTGNFLGVAIFVQRQEVVLVSEMEAGWYRYVSEWRFGTDGTIRPRFGFSAVQSSCVCTTHHHHACWRLDFDPRTPGNNLVRECNDPPLFGSGKWHDKNYEIRRPRDPSRKRKWRVENKATGEACDIIPRHDDGVSTAEPDSVTRLRDSSRHRHRDAGHLRHQRRRDHLSSARGPDRSDHRGRVVYRRRWSGTVRRQGPLAKALRAAPAKVFAFVLLADAAFILVQAIA